MSLFEPEEQDKATMLIIANPDSEEAKNLRDIDSLFNHAYAKEVKNAEAEKKEKVDQIMDWYGEFSSRYNVINSNYEGVRSLVNNLETRLGYWGISNSGCYEYESKSFESYAGKQCYRFYLQPSYGVHGDKHPYLITYMNISTPMHVSHNHFGKNITGEAKNHEDILKKGIPDEKNIKEEISKMTFNAFNGVYDSAERGMDALKKSETKIFVGYYYKNDGMKGNPNVEIVKDMQSEFLFDTELIKKDELLKVVKSIYVDIFNEQPINKGRMKDILQGDVSAPPPKEEKE